MHGLTWLPGAWLLIERLDGIVIAASEQLVELLQTSKEELEGRPILTLTVAQEDAGWHYKTFNLELLERPGRYEDMGFVRPDGSTIGVDVQISHPPINSPRQLAICLITDRTEQRRLASELISKHQELRRAFATLKRKSQQLIETQETLEKQNREISTISTKLSRASALAAIGEITAELTHHLNNPLAAAISVQRRLEKMFASTEQPEVRPAISLLGNSLERLKHTINDLKRVYKTSRPLDIPQTYFDLSEQIEGALALMQQRLESFELLIELPDNLPQILGRPSQIQHVIINLLDNAAQALGENGVVHLKAEPINGAVRLVIGDNGPGIAKQMREKVFEPFFTTREQGSGLGLAVVRRNLHSDGATVKIERSYLGGAEFQIEFRSTSQQR